MGRFKVIIIGCGLSGALLGNGLALHAVDYEVYERLDEDAKRDGYQIRVGENALVGMRASLSPEQIHEAVQLFGSASEGSEAPLIVDKHWNSLLDLSIFPNYSRSAPINRVVLRNVLCKPLKDSGRLHYGKKFTGFDIMVPGSEEEQVRAFFDDGTSADCDLLIAADGNQSQANIQLGLNNIVTLDTHACFLTKNELPFAAYRTLPKELLGSPILTSVDNISFYWCAYLPKGFHESSSSSSGPDGPSKVDKTLYNEELASCMLGVAVPRHRLQGCSIQSLDNESKYGLISECFQGWSPLFHKALEFCKGQEIHGYEARCGMDVPLNWREKAATPHDVKKGHPRVWLMGDSIHPMIPNRGMGGNTAMRDTAEVLPLIIELKQAAAGHDPLTTSEFKKACQRYEKAMIPRAFEWVRKSGRTITPFNASNKVTQLGLLLASYALPFVKFWLWVSGGYTQPVTVAEAAELSTK